MGPRDNPGLAKPDSDLRRDLWRDMHVALWRRLARFDQRCALRTWVYGRFKPLRAEPSLGRGSPWKVRQAGHLQQFGDALAAAHLLQLI